MLSIISYIGLGLATVAAIALGAASGLWPTRRLITIREAQRELRQGSSSWLREITGWSVILFWLGILVYTGTVLGEWAATGSFIAAMNRVLATISLILEIDPPLAI
ncbi:MAG: hypothetical protein AAF576_09410 [Pseudomonadota bacterium]